MTNKRTNMHCLSSTRLLIVACVTAVAGLWLFSLLTRHSADLHARELAFSAVDERVIVSLSSFPGRVELVNTTIQSLVRQSLRPTLIYLNIAKQVQRLNNINNATMTIPPVIEALKKELNGLLIINECEDYGPATKLIPTLQLEKDPNTIIITSDDDVVYHPETVLTLVKALHWIPKIEGESSRYVPCWRCETMSTIWPAWQQHYEGVCKGWFSAYAGVAYRRSYFEKDILSSSLVDYSKAPNGCRLHDDVWFSGQLYRRGVRPYVIRPGFESVVSHRPYNHLSIHTVPNTEKDYRNPCVQYFDYFN